MQTVAHQLARYVEARTSALAGSGGRAWLLTALPLLLAATLHLPTSAQTLPPLHDGHWSALSPNGLQPPLARDRGSIYDSKRDRLVALGSDSRVYALDLASGGPWEALPTPALSSSGMDQAIYDTVNDRMVVIDSGSKVYTLSFADPSSWGAITPSSADPPARTYFTVAYDSKRNRLLLFGGGPYDGLFNDVWALTLTGPAQWTDLTPSGAGPLPRWGPLSAYDSAHDRLLVGMGSTSDQYATTNDIWALSLAGVPVWTALNPTGPRPPARMLSSAIYEPSSDALIIYSGYGNVAADVWVLPLGASEPWSLLETTGDSPGVNFSAHIVYRSSIPQMILVGGANSTRAWGMDIVPTVGAPQLATFQPDGGRIGDRITFVGVRLSDVSLVEFNGVPAPIHLSTFSRVETEVPPGATTGTVRVTNPFGASESSLPFFVGEQPLVNSVSPDSGRIGDEVLLRGSHFQGTRTVRFGGTGAAHFSVLTDSTIAVVVDSLATSGPISVSTPAATGTSAFSFNKMADDGRPRMIGVDEIRGDQGGRVMVKWRASDFDQQRAHAVTRYRVWRRAPASQAPPRGQALPSGWMERPRFLASGEVVVDYWEALVELPAAFLKGYAYAAPTLRDSVEGDAAWMAYFIQAVTADPSVFYNSVVDSGYSVDNLAPPTPTSFAVVYGTTANTLHWRGRVLADLRGYQIYRGTEPTFVPSPATLVATSGDTTYVDAPGGHFYKLAAIDVHGNHSRFVSASPGQPVATLASFVNALREPRRIALTWYSGGNPGLEVNVYRRTLDSDWQLLRVILADGDGFLRYEDADVVDDVRYGYRLGIVEPEVGESMLGETWVDPVRAQFAVLGSGANPSRDGRVSLSFALPLATTARVQLFDIAGREVDSRQIGGGSATSRTVEFGAGARLRAGVYLVRAASGSVILTRRIVVLN